MSIIERSYEYAKALEKLEDLSIEVVFRDGSIQKIGRVFAEKGPGGHVLVVRIARDGDEPMSSHDLEGYIYGYPDLPILIGDLEGGRSQMHEPQSTDAGIAILVE